VTVPTAPLLKVTVFRPGVGENPKPLMVTVLASAATLVVALLTTGVTVATWIAVPLLIELVVTTAVSCPAVLGLVEKVTVRAVAVAAVTVPAAPLLKTTVLSPGVVLKPNPLIVTVSALAAKSAVLLVTTGTTVATCTAALLLTLLLVTIAVKLPAVVGEVESETVNVVDVAAVTVPTAPLLNTTVLSPGVVSKAKPWMVIDVALAAKFSVTAVTTGKTLATCTAVPLLRALEVTLAVILPTVSGWDENVTVSAVFEALVTVPTAPLLKVTRFSSTTELKPKPLITTVEVFAAKSAVLLVTTGFTVATFTGAPLLALLEVTTTVRSPAASGFVENVTVSDVAVAAVTFPTAPLLKTTLVFAALVSNPKPSMVMVSTLASKSLALVVTTGTTVAT
jgi:hypothetical protein